MPGRLLKACEYLRLPDSAGVGRLGVGVGGSHGHFTPGLSKQTDTPLPSVGSEGWRPCVTENGKSAADFFAAIGRLPKLLWRQAEVNPDQPKNLEEAVRVEDNARWWGGKHGVGLLNARCQGGSLGPL